VHMKDLGHPVAGDRKYGARTNPVGRLCLHATILAVKHPVTREVLRFESKVPREFMRLVVQRNDDMGRAGDEVNKSDIKKVREKKKKRRAGEKRIRKVEDWTKRR